MRFSLRAARPWAFLAVLLVLASPLAAQSTGKLQGRVTDEQTGQPIQGAQVVIVGTQMGNITNDEGFYFILNVPADLHDIQAQFIGYQSTTVLQERVLAGQTHTVDFQLNPSAVTIQGIEIVGESRPLVPRDQVASKNIVTGETVDNLPVDDVNQVLVLQPGVVSSTRGISIRGGRSGEEAVYVDGVLIRNLNAGSSRLQIGTNSLSEVDVLTGGFSAEYGNAQSGIINFVTRTGGQQWAGNFSIQSDEMMPSEWSRGLNRAELSLGGPIWGDLSFFGAATAEGRRFCNCQNNRTDDYPIYVIGGVDTVITMQDASAPSLGQTDTRDVVVPEFVRFDEGGQRPLSQSDEFTLDGKLDYGYGQGSRVFLTSKISRNQNRTTGNFGLFNPSSYSGSKFDSRALILGWTHQFVQSAERALALDVKVARTQDEFLGGALAPEWDVDHRDTFMGFTMDGMEFLVNEDNFPVDQTLVSNFLKNEGRRTPFDQGRTDLRGSSEFRMNPYAITRGTVGTFNTAGVTPAFNYNNEKQWQVRATVDWQANRQNRVKFGGEYLDVDLAAASTNLQDQGFADVWVETPKLASLFVQDRIDLGDIVVEGGLRWDHFDPNSDFPVTAGYFDPEDASTFEAAPSRSKLSPRLGVSFPVTVNSTFRLSYGHFVQLPDLNEYYQGKNVDFFRFRNTNTNDIFGRPLELGKTIAFEFGYRQLLAPDFVLDVSAYNRDKLADVTVRKLAWDDPTVEGQVVYLNTLTNADFGSIRGIDLRLDRRFGNVLDIMAGYSYQDAKNTGTDPFTFTNIFARQESNANQLLGLPPNPAQAIRATEENRKHNLTGNLSLQFPRDHDNAVLRNLGLFATARFASGQPYTPLADVGEALPTCWPCGANSGVLADDEISSAVGPWSKNFDLKASKGVSLMGYSASVFLDVRNLFDFENWTAIYQHTGDIVAEDSFDRLVLSERQSVGGGVVRDEIDLTSLSDAGAGVTNDVDLYLLQRAEARFGDGDMLFTAEEQDAAFRSALLLGNGPQTFIGSGRRMRLGFEISF